MGRSDPYVFNFYASHLVKRDYNSVGFFGQPTHNQFSNFIISEDKSFYDMSLGNWEINSFPYKASKKFDLIVCTRCCYFSKQPKKMIKEFQGMLNPGGKIFIDWGLGDHWRFDKYKVGWIKDGEHEWAYDKDNYLWSTIWDKKFLESYEVARFKKGIEKMGYYNLEDAIFDEVPVVVDPNEIGVISVSFLTLWEESSPQIYISTIIGENNEFEY